MSSKVSKRALITGASSGIGKATALAFAKAGIDLALVSRSQDKLEAVARDAKKAGVEAQAYAVDLAQTSEVREKIQAIATELGYIDILVNNAGIGYTALLSETPLADWQRVIDINLTSPFECIQAVLPTMRARGSGTILNIASIGGKQTFPQWGAYCASKFGLMALSKTLASEERANGIRVTAICPGSVNTSLWDTKTVQGDFDRNSMLTPEIVAELILNAATVPNISVVEELTIMPNIGTF
jgi:short-subunit dehydrogenase